MNIVMALRNEEKKLRARLGGIQQAIRALNGTGSASVVDSGRGSKLKGKKLSAAHRLAIKRGIAKRRAEAKAAQK